MWSTHRWRLSGGRQTSRGQSLRLGGLNISPGETEFKMLLSKPSREVRERWTGAKLTPWGSVLFHLWRVDEKMMIELYYLKLWKAICWAADIFILYNNIDTSLNRFRKCVNKTFCYYRSLVPAAAAAAAHHSINHFYSISQNWNDHFCRTGSLWVWFLVWFSKLLRLFLLFGAEERTEMATGFIYGVYLKNNSTFLFCFFYIKSAQIH